jgi:hypothetical protein
MPSTLSAPLASFTRTCGALITSGFTVMGGSSGRQTPPCYSPHRQFAHDRPGRSQALIVNAARRCAGLDDSALLSFFQQAAPPGAKEILGQLRSTKLPVTAR